MPEQSGIFYTDQGEGIPVVLIHGFCESHKIWDGFSKILSKDFRVLCIDLPGFGNSSLLNEPFSISDVATRVMDWADGLQIRSSIVIGHSLGGYVALAMAEKRPELLKAFGLFHSTAYADSEEKKLSRNKVIEFVNNHGVQPFIESFIPPLFYDQSNPVIQSVVALASGTKQATLTSYVKAMRDRPDRTHVLQGFNAPVLFLAGEKDAGIPPDLIRKQAAVTAKPKLELLQSIAHMGMFENETLTVEKTRQFLREVLNN